MTQAFDLWRRGFSWKAIRSVIRISKLDLLLLAGALTFCASMFAIVAATLYAGQARAAEGQSLARAWTLTSSIERLEAQLLACLNGKGGLWVDGELYGCYVVPTGFKRGDFRG